MNDFIKSTINTAAVISLSPEPVIKPKKAHDALFNALVKFEWS